MDLPTSIKTLELDKICRVCLTVKKDMRPLFGEMIADMLMECARIQVNNLKKFLLYIFFFFVYMQLQVLPCILYLYTYYIL